MVAMMVISQECKSCIRHADKGGTCKGNNNTIPCLAFNTGENEKK